MKSQKRKVLSKRVVLPLNQQHLHPGPGEDHADTLGCCWGHWRTWHSHEVEVPAALFSAQAIIATPTECRNTKQTSFSHSLVLVSAETPPPYSLPWFNLPGTVWQTCPRQCEPPSRLFWAGGWTPACCALWLQAADLSDKPFQKQRSFVVRLAKCTSHTPAAPELPACGSLWFLVYWWPVYTYFFSSRALQHCSINSLPPCGLRKSNHVSAQPKLALFDIFLLTLNSPWPKLFLCGMYSCLTKEHCCKLVYLLQAEPRCKCGICTT